VASLRDRDRLRGKWITFFEAAAATHELLLAFDHLVPGSKPLSISTGEESVFGRSFTWPSEHDQVLFTRYLLIVFAFAAILLLRGLDTVTHFNKVLARQLFHQAIISIRTALR